MNVTELIEQLSAFDPNLEVIMSTDKEGTDFRFMDLIGLGVWEPKHFEFQSVEETDVANCVILWP